MMTVHIHIVVYGVYLSSDLLLTFKNDIDYCSYYVHTYVLGTSTRFIFILHL